MQIEQRGLATQAASTPFESLSTPFEQKGVPQDSTADHIGYLAPLLPFL
ncbi:hypothetical protein [Tumebacillus algifaecis]|nr:hypothetical protein [Tumebacillus algifaecis]